MARRHVHAEGYEHERYAPHDWCAGRIPLPHDWTAVAQVRTQAWEAAVRQRQLQAQLMRPRMTWRQRAGVWLIRMGGWLTRLGATMAEQDRPQRVSVTG